MIRYLLFLVLMSGLFLTGCKEDEIGPTQSCALTQPDSSQLHPKNEAFVELLNKYTHKGLPGIILLVRDPDGRWVGAAGKADIKKGLPMSPCYVSKVASVTKIFIGTLVMKMVGDGTLDLDDPITKWLPGKYTDKVANADQATLRQLLNHTSGIYDIIESNAFYLQVLNNPGKFWDSEELLKFAYGQPAVFPTGTQLEYSNTNLLLAAMIIEKAGGRPHAGLLHERVIDPLGLADTYYHWHDPLPDEVAQGYYDLYNNGDIVNMSNFNTGSGNGYGGMYATVYDMQVFIEALLRDKTLLSPELLAEMTAITAEDPADLEAYGVTIRKDFIDRAPDEYALGHRGRDLAYTADLFYFPEKDVTIALLINYGTDADSDLKEVFLEFREELADVILGE